ncbi:SGT1 protein-domain-containing protein [Corynascus similis CBS 632.67]
MEAPVDPRPGDEEFDGFRMQLSEDCVEYMLFVIGEKDNKLPSLEAVRKAADKKLDELAKDYIWQRDPFKLEIRTQKGLGLPYLYGTTHYGDNVEDEWLIVYLLRELSKSFASLWIRVSDSDGEFLLIEAAKVTPKWLSPENDTNRVWIHDGKLLIIPLSTPANSSTTAARTATGSTVSSSPSFNSKPLTLREAIDTIKTVPPTALVHSPLIDAEALYRLEKYPAQIAASIHHSLVTIPRKLAYILHTRPAAVAPATEAFYLRDPHALKPLLRSSSSAADNNLTFPPTDLVTVSVRFTKVLYAQLKSQRFAPPPPAWRQLLHAAEVAAASATAASVSASTGPELAKRGEREEAKKKLARLDMGMKLTTGFEILCRTPPEQSASRVVREVGLLLEDLAEDGGDSALPTDDEIARWEGVQREDDDGWMDIDFRDFERELDGEKGQAKRGVEEGSGFGDASAQADLQKIVSRFEAFLNDESAGIEGAEIDEMDRDNDDDSDEESYEDGTDEDEDKEVSFDEEQFSRMMREMMGLPAEDVGQGSGNAKVSAKEPGEQGENDDEEIRKMMEQMESELKGLGALELDPKPKKATTTIKERGEGKPEPAPSEQNEEEEEEEEEESDKEVDIDYNLAKNLLESFKSQAGMAGPAGNLLGLMGMTLPRDEEGSDNSE